MNAVSEPDDIEDYFYPAILALFPEVKTGEVNILIRFKYVCALVGGSSDTNWMSNALIGDDMKARLRLLSGPYGQVFRKMMEEKRGLDFEVFREKRKLEQTFHYMEYKL